MHLKIQRFLIIESSSFLVVVLLMLSALQIRGIDSLAQGGALVTGATDGIGLTTAKNLAAKGYTVLLHGRNRHQIDQAADQVRFVQEEERVRAVSSSAVVGDANANSRGAVVPLPPFDLSSLRESVGLTHAVKRTCSENGISLCLLVHNEAVFSKARVHTSEGLEYTFAVNVAAPFVITSHLLPLLLRQKSRIVIATSISQCSSIRNWEYVGRYKHSPAYNAHKAYSETKLMDTMLTMEMAARFQGAFLGTDRITCNCLDPGSVNAKISMEGWGPCSTDVAHALDETWLCTSKEVEHVTAKYFLFRQSRVASMSAYDPSQRHKLWTILSTIAPDAANMWDAL